jgi:6-phosphogluconolactonase/glucosamine-6-phosphate isomerase/deaminase
VPKKPRFIEISDSRPVEEYIYNRILKQLKSGHKVLWLVPGGSAMAVAAAVAEKLNQLPNLSGLTVNLTDERYGPTDHADSNWLQLAELGFNLPGARFEPVLNGGDLSKTAAGYTNILIHALEQADFCLALAGMGPDGHIFGIKPGSPAVNAKDMVIGYKWEDFVRLTPTISLIKLLDEVVLYVVGKEKHRQLDTLDKEITATEQPAQLLKQAKNVTIFNDYKGGSV